MAGVGITLVLFFASRHNPLHSPHRLIWTVFLLSNENQKEGRRLEVAKRVRNRAFFDSRTICENQNGLRATYLL